MVPNRYTQLEKITNKTDYFKLGVNSSRIFPEKVFFDI